MAAELARRRRQEHADAEAADAGQRPSDPSGAGLGRDAGETEPGSPALEPTSSWPDGGH